MCTRMKYLNQFKRICDTRPGLSPEDTKKIEKHMTNWEIEVCW